jgi:hypothetical protein
MRISDIYRNTATAFIGIGVAALLALWGGGWAIASFMNHAYGFYGPAIRCAIPIGHARLPFWPIASLTVLIMHGVFMFRYSSLSARLGVPRRWWEGITGGYDAQLENPFARVIAKDFIVVGLLLGSFLVLSSCRHWFGWYWWGC